MKRMVLMTVTVAGLAAFCGVAIQMKRQTPKSEAVAAPAVEPQSVSSTGPIQREESAAGRRRLSRERSVQERGPSSTQDNSLESAVTPSTEADPVRPSQIIFNQAIESVASPQASHEQKEVAWKQLREAGKLDLAIGELEQRAATNPAVASYPAALGQAYLQKCGTIQDVREQGILAMKADQVFDAALNLEPNNWEARFTKAVAMSFWPTQMNKGNEVMQHFVTLVEQQEAQSPQAHFAQTYVRLGDEYQKYGHAEYAKQAWQRGAALFPEDRELRLKLQPR